MTWPATAVVGRAYLDQLARTRGLPADRASAVRSALDRADSLTARSNGAGDAARQLDALAAQLEPAAAAASQVDRGRISALAALLKTRASALR